MRISDIACPDTSYTYYICLNHLVVSCIQNNVGCCMILCYLPKNKKSINQCNRAITAHAEAYTLVVESLSYEFFIENGIILTPTRLI